MIVARLKDRENHSNYPLSFLKPALQSTVWSFLKSSPKSDLKAAYEVLKLVMKNRRNSLFFITSFFSFLFF